QSRDHQRGDLPEYRGYRYRQRAGNGAEFADGGDAAPAKEGDAGRGDDNREHQPERTEPGASEHEYQHDRQDADSQGLQVELSGMEQGVEGADDPVGPGRLIAG